MPRAKRDTLPMGRPKKKLDWEVIDKMLLAGCYGTSIASKFGMHHTTFYDRCFLEKGMSFTEYSAQKLEEGNDLIRQVRFSKALKGDNTQLIWLSKVRLGEVETTKQIVEAKHDITQLVLEKKPVLELPDNGNREIATGDATKD